jgi:hypothetical protein
MGRYTDKKVVTVISLYQDEGERPGTLIYMYEHHLC